MSKETKKDFIEWDDKYLVFVPQLDEAHLGLFMLVNKLYDVYSSSNSDPKQVRRIFHEFLEYTYSHFADEEIYLEQIKFSHLKEHKLLHKKIKKTFEEYFNQLKQGTLDIKLFLDFTKKWLLQHITKEDKNYFNK